MCWFSSLLAIGTLVSKAPNTSELMTGEQMNNTLKHSAKHEIIPCERCNSAIECKANSYTKCQCSVVQLSINEVQYISELYDGCLCAKCLFELQQEYREEIGI
nr:cysteine-rich CWC family protein [Pedobacter kyonggii]